MKKTLIIAFILNTLFQSPSYAITPWNYAEMGLALASIPVEVAAHAKATKDDKKGATRLHIITDFLNILNKSLFFYNNISSQTKAENLHIVSKELAVNGALLSYNMIKLGKHIQNYVHTKNEPIVSVSDLETRYQIPALAYPILKGLSAFALACSQDNTTNYASKQARIIASLAHSFFTLLDEHSQLGSHAQYKKLVSASILANAAWLAYELSKMGDNSLATKSELMVSKQELREILNTRAGAITCVRGHYAQRPSQAQITVLEHALEAELTAKGLKFIRADGHYNGGHIPNSYIILDIKEPELAEMAQRHAQFSVVLFNNDSAKLLYLRGPNAQHFHAAQSWKEVQNPADDCTSVKTTDGVFRFTYNFDFAKPPVLNI